MKAGWAHIDVTPPLGLPMGGRGCRFAPGEEVLAPLIAQALLLEDDDGRRTLWLSVDLIGVTVARGLAWRHELAAVAATPADAVLVNFAHTHAGPMINIDGYATVIGPTPEMLAYEADLLQRLLVVTARAVEALQPVEMRLHVGESQIGINRRGINPETGEMSMRPNPEGAYNRELWVIDLQGTGCQDTGGRAVVYAHSCHPVIVYGHKWQSISPDFVGVSRQCLGDSLGADTHCQFVQSLAGNVRPRAMAEADRFRKSVPEDVTDTGECLAGDVMRALSDAGTSIEPRLEAASGSFLARRLDGGGEGLDHWQGLVDDEDELTRNCARYWVDRLQSGIPPARGVPWPAGVLQLDDEHAVAWLAGEPVAEWLAVMRQVLGDGVIAWGYTQSVASYLPTDALLPEGGYEALNANRHSRFGPGPFAPGLDDTVRAHFAEMAARIRHRR